MTQELTTTRRSRRGLLAAGAAAVAAAAAAAVTRFDPAAAADGDSVTVGSRNTGSTVTTFNITGDTAVAGVSDSARGLDGTSTSGQGVHGESSSSAGVAGVSDSGNGVHGTSTSNRGVFGQSTSGTGVVGSGAIGVSASGSSGGYALETTSGRLKFEGVSGIATVPGGDTQLTVKPVVEISGSTLVFLTPEANINGRDLWYTKSSEGDLIIHLSESRQNDLKVSYLLIDHM